MLVLVGVIVAALVGAGIWWGVSAATSSSADGAASAVSGAHAAPAALPDDTRMGVVELVTDDLGPMRDFYVDAVGLEVLEESADSVRLGNGGEALLEITLDGGRAPDSMTQAGLFHTAILYPTRQVLADVLVRIATVSPTSYGGSADHAVSLAFYFADPDGNGLELYTDTPEEQWVWEDGLVQMGSAPLDPNAFIQQHASRVAGPAAPGAGNAAGSVATTGDSGATMGHVHLRVGDLEEARAFYADTLGFAVTAESNGALFYAAGGYHHHVATNTWNSAGAGPRPESLGLGGLTVHLGSAAALDAVAMRLSDAQLAHTYDGGVLVVDDPWGNTVRLLA